MAGRVKSRLYDLFAVTSPGLAAFCGAEALRCGLLAESAPSAVEAGGVNLSGNHAALYRANLHLRTASRVLVRLGEFHAENFEQLQSRASLLAWEKFLTPGCAVDLRVTCHKSRLYHSGAVAERIVNAIGDRLRQPPNVQKADEESDEQGAQLVVVRLMHDVCTISIDSSGALLHRRGYRLATAKAPLRETLAAGLLLASGWDAQADAPPPLLDPFCGSGAIPIEAALMARQIAPGRRRRFAFMDWPDFDATLWQSLLDEADEHVQQRSAQLADGLIIQASDRDAGAIASAQANAARAGVASDIEFTCRAVSAIEPPSTPGYLVANPPYGQRIRNGSDLRNLYAQLGKVLRSRCPGWQVAILGSDQVALGQIGLRLDTELALVNGGIHVVVARGVVGAAR
ncbi:MAG TPA: class I SAM-dependent RNA methyltransferase [Caldilinea sp.]|nr:class I SAM-dependent RNA methyltransferase [Caldilinea sp.]HRA66331.1 class I SAM-dependent RNA methyltransferase [Caldilinea sp.]